VDAETPSHLETTKLAWRLACEVGSPPGRGPGQPRHVIPADPKNPNIATRSQEFLAHLAGFGVGETVIWVCSSSSDISSCSVITFHWTWRKKPPTKHKIYFSLPYQDEKKPLPPLRRRPKREKPIYWKQKKLKLKHHGRREANQAFSSSIFSLENNCCRENIRKNIIKSLRYIRLDWIECSPSLPRTIPHLRS
jgi:hypothetical protein